MPGDNCSPMAKVACGEVPDCRIGPSFTRPTAAASLAEVTSDVEAELAAVVSLPMSPGRPPGAGRRQLLDGACVWSTSDGGVDDDDAEVFRNA